MNEGLADVKVDVGRFVITVGVDVLVIGGDVGGDVRAVVVGIAEGLDVQPTARRARTKTTIIRVELYRMLIRDHFLMHKDFGAHCKGANGLHRVMGHRWLKSPTSAKSIRPLP